MLPDRELASYYNARHLFVLTAALGDALSVGVAGLLTELLGVGQLGMDGGKGGLVLLATAAMLLSLAGRRSYTAAKFRDLGSQAKALTLAAAWAVGAVLTAAHFSPQLDHVPAGWLLSWGSLALLMVLSSRVVAARILNHLTADFRVQERVAIVGASDSKPLVDRLGFAADELRLVGIFDDRRERSPDEVGKVPVLGTTDDLLEQVRKGRIDRVIVALPWSAQRRLTELSRKLRAAPVRVDLGPAEVLQGFHQITVQQVAGIPLVTISRNRLSSWNGMLKTIEDVVIASTMLAVLSPLLALIAMAIRLDSKGPALFRQKRHGFNNRVFEIYKFRTMRPGDDREVRQATRDDARVTRIGRFLRRTSLDELPQLFNVLEGKMSIVGPRPHAVAHNLEYAAVVEDYFARHNVKPGITGWAQVNGLRGEIDSPGKLHKRIHFDLHYVDNWSILLDLKIILLTAVKVWFHDTAY